MFDQDLVEPSWVQRSFRVFLHTVAALLLIGLFSCGMFYWVILPAAAAGFLVGFGQAGFARSGRWVWIVPLVIMIWWIVKLWGVLAIRLTPAPGGRDLEVAIVFAPIAGLVAYGLAVNAGLAVSERVKNQANTES